MSKEDRILRGWCNVLEKQCLKTLGSIQRTEREIRSPTILVTLKLALFLRLQTLVADKRQDIITIFNSEELSPRKRGSKQTYCTSRGQTSDLWEEKSQGVEGTAYLMHAHTEPSSNQWWANGMLLLKILWITTT